MNEEIKQIIEEMEDDIAFFIRIHHDDCPEFSPENAFSYGLGGPEARLDEAPQGYSCCDSAEDLIDYFECRGGAPEDAPVVVFTGRQIANGDDFEPLVMPDMDFMMWTDYKALARVFGP